MIGKNLVIMGIIYAQILCCEYNVFYFAWGVYDVWRDEYIVCDIVDTGR